MGEIIDEEVAKAWLNLSKVLGQNAMGEWGELFLQVSIREE